MRTPGTAIKGLNHWVILKDNHATNCNAVSLCSRHSPTAHLCGQISDTVTLAATAREAGMTLRFRLLVDQDEGERAEESPVIYEGLMVPFDKHGEDADGFEPLEDFGTPNFGCCYMEYWQAGKGGGWKQL
jgi:hypothetical protein